MNYRSNEILIKSLLKSLSQNLIIAICLFMIFSISEAGNVNNSSFKFPEIDTGMISIVIPDKPSLTEKFAAEEIKRYLSEMTSRDYPIVKESSCKSKRKVEVGKTERNSELAIKLKLKEKDIDGFIVNADHRRINLIGNCDRATLYAAYKLLEMAGCTWLAPGIDDVPRKKEFSIPGGTRIEEPAFKYRIIRYIKVPCGKKWDKLCLDWAVKMRINFASWGKEDLFTPLPNCIVKRGGIRGIQIAHCVDRFMTRNLFKKHPEWFPLLDGKRKWIKRSQVCTNAPGTAEYFADIICKFFDKHPEIEVFPMTQADGISYCECKKCIAEDSGAEWNKGKPVVTDRWLNFVNKVAVEVAKKYPDKMLYTLAYHQTMKPPLKIVPVKNVAIEVVHSRPKYVDFIHRWNNKNSPKNIKFLVALKQWLRLSHGNVFVYDYYPHSTFWSLPYGAYKKVFSDLTLLKQLGGKGFEAQSAIRIMGSYLPLMYAISQAMWNPALSPDKTMKSYLLKMYGESGQYIKDYLDCLETARENCPVNSTEGIFAYLSKKTISDAEKHMQKALDAAESATTKKRLQVLHDEFLYAKNYRLGIISFDKYRKTGNIKFLNKSVEHLDSIIENAKLILKSKGFRKMYGINWTFFAYPKKLRGIVAINKQYKMILQAANLKIPEKKGIKVGIFALNLGGKELLRVLEKNKIFNPFMIPNLKMRILKKCDVVIVSNTGNMYNSFNSSIKSLRKWVKNGGKLILMHDAIGRKKHKTAFPEIGTADEAHRADREIKSTSNHTITGIIKADTAFKHNYYGHVNVIPTAKSEILLSDTMKRPVLTVATLGKGKVVLNGMLTGYGTDEFGVKSIPMEPYGMELKIIENCILWLRNN